MPVSVGTPNAPAGQVIVTKSGWYTPLGSSHSTSASLGVGTLRASPIYVPKRVTLDRIGAEITVIGDVGSKLRLGIYNDNGNIYPGSLLLDAGTINGDSATVQEITISQVLEPGVYWLAGAVQVVTVLQPTVRTGIEIPFCPSHPSSNAGIASDLVGLTQSGSISGALPASFTVAVASGSIPRIFVRAV